MSAINLPAQVSPLLPADDPDTRVKACHASGVTCRQIDSRYFGSAVIKGVIRAIHCSNSSQRKIGWTDQRRRTCSGVKLMSSGAITINTLNVVELTVKASNVA